MEFAEYIKSPSIDNVLLKRRNTPYIEGTLCITGHHLIFSSRTQRSEELFLLISGVEHVEKKFVGQEAILTICCKNFDLVKMRINDMEKALNLISTIDALSTLENQTLKYPFFYRHVGALSGEDGWDMFSNDLDFAKVCSSTQSWRISHVNINYEVCASYPTSVIVPLGVSDDELKASAQFRHGARFPVLCYFHKATQSVLMRSGEPLCGSMSNKRCKEDEKLVNSALGSMKKGMIVDTRSTPAVMNSRSKGGGLEPESNYPQWKRSNHNIEKHTVLIDSVCKLMEACFDQNLSMNAYLSRLESCGWMDQIQAVLGTACYVAHCLHTDGIPVLVHDGAGLDATLQVTSLSQVILDPDCRTVRGFQSLVDREWIRGGHPFSNRCTRVGFSSTKYKGQGPVFLLFLDCVWQIYQQFPCSFEFHDSFLICLFEHAYYSQFGTFLCNNEKNRVTVKLKEKTISLWSYLNQDEILEDMLNPMYERNESVLWPSVAPQSLVLWPGLYLKWQKQQRNGDSFWLEARRVQDLNKDLKLQAAALREEFTALQAEVLELRKLNTEPKKPPEAAVS
ncbi:predicted protein [Nematostella vectensis]|uniref:Myotubularin phosphatase domain-containing protein n=1 Tax=Nematostella vectensis TaxID=45351 RepID=A7SR96_NEMVE|nr:predicted protein [Nematostella vectensis]|eukprot:XP_001625874.1 predicted protein [Nematostella vectensis]